MSTGSRVSGYIDIDIDIYIYIYIAHSLSFCRSTKLGFYVFHNCVSGFYVVFIILKISFSVIPNWSTFLSCHSNYFTMFSDRQSTSLQPKNLANFKKKNSVLHTHTASSSRLTLIFVLLISSVWFFGKQKSPDFGARETWNLNHFMSRLLHKFDPVLLCEFKWHEEKFSRLFCVWM